MKKWWIGAVGVVLVAVVVFLSFNMGEDPMKSAESNKNADKQSEQKAAQQEQNHKQDKQNESKKKQGGISTHVLNQAQGTPAAGVPVTLYEIDKLGKKKEINKAKTAKDGRVQELLAPDKVKESDYEIIFSVGSYFKKNGSKTEFLNEIPVRFHVEDTTQHYHVPIVAAPGGYSTYHGS